MTFLLFLFIMGAGLYTIFSTIFTWIEWGAPWWFPSRFLVSKLDKAAWDVMWTDMQENAQDWKRTQNWISNPKKRIYIWINGIAYTGVHLEDKFSSNKITPPLYYRKLFNSYAKKEAPDVYKIVEKFRE